MTQPHWTAIILGGGGVAGGVISFITLVTNRLIEGKEETIKSLTRENKKLQEKFVEERTRRKDLFDAFEDHLQSIDTNRFSSADMLRIKEVFDLLQEIGDLTEGFEDCEKAAEWLKGRKRAWAVKSSKQAARKYKHLLPWYKLKKFQNDMEQYLDWVCDCLSKYGGRTVNVPITEFMEMPTLTSPYPYIAAINYLIELDNWGELSQQPREYLKEVLALSAEQLPNEFRQVHKKNLQVS